MPAQLTSFRRRSKASDAREGERALRIMVVSPSQMGLVKTGADGCSAILAGFRLGSDRGDGWSSFGLLTAGLGEDEEEDEEDEGWAARILS